VAASRASSDGWRKSLLSTFVPTRRLRVAPAALRSAGIGERKGPMWSGMASTA